MERVAGGLLRGPCIVASELVLNAQSCSAQIYTSKPFEIDMHAFFFFGLTAPATLSFCTLICH